MIQPLRQIKRRIRTVENTKKITRAMEIISVAKLRPLQNRLLRAKEYFLKVEGVLNHCLASFADVPHPLLEEREKKAKVSVCLITSDTGLCGSYNNDLIDSVEAMFLPGADKKVSLFAVGRKGFSHFKRSAFEIFDAYTEMHGRYSLEITDKIARILMDRFLSGEADEVYVAYTYFDSAARRRPVVEKFLNIPRVKSQDVLYLVEPDIKAFLEDFLPLCLSVKMRFMMLNALAAEHSARGLAMREASDNATEMFEELILLRNKVRQTTITKEIIEVISSADALKG